MPHRTSSAASLKGRAGGRLVVLATGNAGKLREFRALLSGLPYDLQPQSALGVQPIAETGTTFRENALLKARHAADATGAAALADDSGLEVDALGGAPGVWSARYAGEAADDVANNAKLIAALAGVPQALRSARYRCCLVFVASAGAQPVIAEGSWEGLIVDTPRGDGGFGYDAHFLVPELGLTAAELTAADKNRRSHRGIASAALLRALCGLS
jgi:XTP/dITP diphosphohydrolase